MRPRAGAVFGLLLAVGIAALLAAAMIGFGGGS